MRVSARIASCCALDFSDRDTELARLVREIAWIPLAGVTSMPMGGASLQGRIEGCELLTREAIELRVPGALSGSRRPAMLPVRSTTPAHDNSVTLL